MSFKRGISIVVDLIVILGSIMAFALKSEVFSLGEHSQLSSVRLVEDLADLSIVELSLKVDWALELELHGKAV